MLIITIASTIIYLFYCFQEGVLLAPDTTGNCPNTLIHIPLWIWTYPREAQRSENLLCLYFDCADWCQVAISDGCSLFNKTE